ncbi:leucine-rich repeat protein [Flammeovirga sp. OC4]|uniref:leucine-rich repeat protein n=1 Tax=Flammeovirga sp. OC4 TaxID=1382345 RepID=UPI0005C5B821|nr:leucine-rich repeat protein [Flammeovirga sp. OC4]
MKYIIQTLLLFLIIPTGYAQQSITLTYQNCIVENGTLHTVFIPNGYDKVTIPSAINGEAIKRIENEEKGVFQGKDITEIILPEGLEYIGKESFRDNNLSSVTLPQTIRHIGWKAFDDNPLSTIPLPDLEGTGYYEWRNGYGKIVTEIKYHYYEHFATTDYIIPEENIVMEGNTLVNLSKTLPTSTTAKYLVFPESVNGVEIHYINTSENGLLFKNKGLINVQLPKYLIEIGADEFSDNTIKHLQLPSGLKTIGKNAFRNNLLQEVTLPSSLRFVGESAFYENEIQELLLPENEEGLQWSTPSPITDFGPYFHIIENWYTLQPKDVVMENNTIVEVTSILVSNNIIIPDFIGTDTVKAIGGTDITGVFRNKNIDQLLLSDSIEVIGEHAFSENNISEIQLPKNLKEIKDYAFADNTITTIILPEHVRTLGQKCFMGTPITTFQPNSTLEVLHQSIFRCAEELHIDFSTTSITTLDLQNSPFEDLHRFPIPLPTFEENPNFNGWYTIQNGEEIKVEEAENNRGLYQAKFKQSLNAENTVVVNGEIISTTLESIEHLVIPSEINGQKITRVGDRAFYNKKIQSLTLNEELTSIGSYGFGWNAIQEVVWSENLVEIGEHAFASNNLTTLALPENIITIGEGSFRNNDLVHITLNNKITFIGREAFNWNPSQEFKLPKSDIPHFSHWKSIYNTYSAGIYITHSFSLEAVSRYTLKEDDITVEDGKITSCGDLPKVHILSIPPYLHGQNITGIADKRKGEGVFEGKEIRDFEYAEILTYIGDFAFYNNQLTSIRPNEYTHIGRNAFASNLIYKRDDYLLPTSVKFVGHYAFYNNTGLKVKLNSSEHNYYNDEDEIVTGYIKDNQSYRIGNIVLSMDQKWQKEVVVYPTEVTNLLTIKNADGKSFSVYTTEGRLLKEQQTITNSLYQANLSTLKKGLYILYLFDEKGNKKAFKIIKK